MSSVAEEGYATEVPGGKRIPIHHRVLVDNLRVADELDDIKEFESESVEGAQNLFSLRDVRPVLRGACQMSRPCGSRPS